MTEQQETAKGFFRDRHDKNATFDEIRRHIETLIDRPLIKGDGILLVAYGRYLGTWAVKPTLELYKEDNPIVGDTVVDVT